jgi:drug/metabolite transporter (DMT)-like permease
LFTETAGAEVANRFGIMLNYLSRLSVSEDLMSLIRLLQYLSNAALALTSVASTTILSSTAGLFTLAFGTLLGHDTFNVSKAIAVIVSITGVAMTTMGKTWSSEIVEHPDVDK